ncbi:hypothetical protein ACFE04_012862 [Oxalis oulophora]
MSKICMCTVVLVLLALMLFVVTPTVLASSRQSGINNIALPRNVEGSERLQSSTNTTLARSEEEIFEELSKHAVDDPESVANEVAQISEWSMGNHTERRELGYFSCATGNPIDDCWRCDPNWQKNRKKLANCGIGFGRNAIGGRDGRYYVVTDPSDHDAVNPRPGTLRHAVIQDEPLWIVFKRDMVIQCRHGYFHVVNNDYTHWEMYAIGGSADPTINSQGNRYAAPANRFAKEVTKRVDTSIGHWKNWNWRSEGDMLVNGAYFTPSGAGASASYARASSLAAKSSSMVKYITSSAGPLSCRNGRECS